MQTGVGSAQFALVKHASHTLVIALQKGMPGREAQSASATHCSH
jgi:hypothetical protein